VGIKLNRSYFLALSSNLLAGFAVTIRGCGHPFQQQQHRGASFKILAA
jgi:hypothetical protein